MNNLATIEGNELHLNNLISKETGEKIVLENTLTENELNEISIAAKNAADDFKNIFKSI